MRARFDIDIHVSRFRLRRCSQANFQHPGQAISPDICSTETFATLMDYALHAVSKQKLEELRKQVRRSKL